MTEITHDPTVAQFTRTVRVAYDWDDEAPTVTEFTSSPIRVRKVRITYTWADATWKLSDYGVLGARIKKNGEPYDEQQEISWRVRYRGADAWLAALIEANRPKSTIVFEEW